MKSYFKLYCLVTITYTLKMWKTLFHLLGALQFGYGCYYDYTYVVIPSTSSVSPKFGGKLKYLTYINALIQTFYFTLAFINDISGSNEPSPSQKPLVRRVKDAVFSRLAFPVAMFVGVTFWAIYAVDRELILPRAFDAYFPTWLNHVMHTNIVIFILIDLFSSFRMYPSRKMGLTVLCSFMLSYMVWIHIIYAKTNMWVYPILNVLNWPMRVAFYIFNLILVCSFYTLGESLNRAAWSKEIEQTVKSGKKKAK